MMAFIEISYSADISANDVNSRLGKFKQFEIMGFQRIMKISYTELYTTNEYVWWTMNDMAGSQWLQRIRRRKLSWYHDISRYNSNFMVLLQGTVEGKRRWERPRQMWLDNISEWTWLSIADLPDSTQDRTQWWRWWLKYLSQRPNDCIGQGMDIDHCG